MNLAKFSINLDLSDQGFDALHTQVLTLRIRQSPPTGVRSTLFQVFDPGLFDPALPISSNPPRSSPGAPVLSLTGTTVGQAVSPAVPDGPVTVTMPGAGVHAWIVRCVVNGGLGTDGRPDPNAVWERLVVIRDPSGRRDVVATERTQYGDDGWAEAFSDFVTAGLSVVASAPFHKDPCRLTTTANIAVLTGTPVIDGVLSVAGDRVLVKAQTVPADNGIYIVAAGAWSRATDCDVSAEVRGGTLVAVSEGAENADSVWQLATNDPITLGVTGLAFVPLGDRQLAAPNIGGTQNNYNPAGFSEATTIRQPVSAGIRIVTGFAAPGAGGRQRKTVWNAGPGTLMLAHEDALSLAANRIRTPEGKRLYIPVDGAVSLSYDFTDARWRATPMGARPFPAGYVAGFVLSPAVVFGTQTVVGFGACRSDDDAFDIVGTPGTLNMAVVGAGGIDVGAIAANTWYAVWVIADSTGTNPVSGLYSTSGVAPTMPVGYDRRRRVGWVRSGGAATLLSFAQTGGSNTRTYYWNAPRASLQALAGGAAVVFTALSLGAWHPAIFCNEVYLDASVDLGNDFVEFRLDNTAIANGQSAFRVTSPSNNRTHGKLWHPTNSLGQLEYRVSAAGADADVFVLGWRETI